MYDLWYGKYEKHGLSVNEYSENNAQTLWARFFFLQGPH